MLKLVWLSQQACQKTLWTQFNPTRQTWVVSDRKSKYFLNRSLLEKYELIHEPVKRAKEYWKEILRLVDPEMHALEDLGSVIQAREFLLKNDGPEWTRRPRAPQKLLNACLNLAPLITHDQAPEILQQFENEFDAGSFLELARMAMAFYQKSLDKKRLPRFFVPFFLAQGDGLPIKGQELIFDLGFEMRDGEKDLIQALSKTNDVSVLIPAKDAGHLEESGLYTYRNFGLGLTQVENIPVPPCQTDLPHVELWRCSSPEAEARKAVEFIARLVGEGVSPDNICVAADNISDYESTLAHDLDWEGIGLRRTLKTRLSASRLFRALNARLHIVKGHLRAALMEEAFLSVAEYKASLRRREERSVLKPVLHEAQIPHAQLKSQVFELKKRQKEGPMAIVEFESLLIDLFSELVEIAGKYEDPRDAEHRNQLFLKALGQLRSEVGDVDLELSLWIEAWEEVTNQIRLNYEQAAPTGVWAVELASTEETPVDYLIILGAVENHNRGSVAGGLNDAQATFLAGLGFDLTTPAKRMNDALMHWLTSGRRKHVVFSCPKTDSKGKAVPASPLWLKMAAARNKNLDSLDFARDTRWIDVQKTITDQKTGEHVDAFKSWPAGTTQKIAALVTQELESTRKVLLAGQSGKPLVTPMSASRIESYWECPFKFFARSYLGLFDEADLEVEPTPQKRGQWLHAAAEQILGSKKELDSWTDEELNTLVDSLDQVQKQISSDIWPNIRSRFVRQLKRFIQFELEWREKYPRTAVLEVEAPLRGVIEWSPSDSQIQFAPGAPLKADDFWAEFRGSVDRVDGATNDRAILLDYKTSATAAANIASWPKKGHFQLALYAEAAEAGLLPFGPKKVIAAQYYSLKKLHRDKGYKLSDEDLSGILPADGNARAAVSLEDRDQYFREIDTLVHGILEKIRQGDFSPNPENEKICPACSWRTSCRAPHLS